MADTRARQAADRGTPRRVRTRPADDRSETDSIRGLAPEQAVALAARTEAGVSVARAVGRLQRTYGNRAVQRLIAAQREAAPDGEAPLQRAVGDEPRRVQRALGPGEGLPRGAIHTPGGPRTGIVVQRALTARANRAFTEAERHRPDWDKFKTATDNYMPPAHQDEVADVGATSRTRESTDAEKRLKDFIRAYLLAEYAERLEKLETDAKYPTPADKARRRDGVYFPKAKELRDKHAPLVAKGVAAPETQGFLRTYGLEAGVPVTPKQQAKALAKGPRVDVRSTFIGGTVLGIRLRAHLFIVYTSSAGKQVYFRGGPSGDNPPLTVAELGDYVPETVDWDPSAPSVTVLKGEKAKEAFRSLISATNRIDAMQVPYVAMMGALDGENCNATAWTILDAAGVPKNKPSGVHPGWGHVLGASSQQGNPMAAMPDDQEAGEVRLVKGRPEVAARLYYDLAKVEPAENVPGRTPIEVIDRYTNGRARIRYNGKIRFMDKDRIGAKPKAPAKGKGKGKRKKK